MGIRLFSYFCLNKVFFDGSPQSLIVFPLPFNATRCSLTPANCPSTHSYHHLTPLRRPLTLTHPFLLPLHRILVHTITIFIPFRHLLMPHFGILALLCRFLTPPHCPLPSPCLPLLPFNDSVMPFDVFSLPFNAYLLPLNTLVILERFLFALLCLPIAFLLLFSAL